MPEDSVNPIPTERGVVQPTCTVPLGYRNCRKTNFDWTVYLFTSWEVVMKYIYCKLSNLIGQFEHTMAHTHIYI